MKLAQFPDPDLPPFERSTRPISGVSFTAVELGVGFWRSRVECSLKVTLPHALDRCDTEGRVRNFQRAAAVLRGETLEDTTPPGYPFDDTDVYKVIEGAAYALGIEPDADLEKRVDDLIEAIAAAQEPDGYLYTTRTISPKAPHEWAGLERWEKETDLSHELYNLGHLFEAAAAHFEATGKRTLLDVAIRAAELLCRTFGPGKAIIWPGHQVAEMGLTRLFLVTGNTNYLNLAKFLLDARGPGVCPPQDEINKQAHRRVVEQTEAVGHAVRAVYQYSGMADLALLGRAPEFLPALHAIWTDIVTHKLYITGGIGARFAGEAFGSPDDLPNLTAYNETCAAIGLAYFCQRMFLLTGKAEYIDVLERVLYNGLLSGIALDGAHFFYPNPLESFGEYGRSPWFGCSCCPGNLARFLPSVSGYLFAYDDDSIIVNLYAASRVSITLPNELTVTLEVNTDYPWDGSVRIKVLPSQANQFTLKLRIPGWSGERVLPSDLYSFCDDDVAAPALGINGVPTELQLVDGYAVLTRRWQAADSIELRLPMPIRRIRSAERVIDNRGRIALQRGPIVYCLEGADRVDGRVLDTFLESDAPLHARRLAHRLGDIVILEGSAKRVTFGDHTRSRIESVELTAIPYFAWANRGKNEMLVWIAESTGAAWVRPTATLASSSRVTLSAGQCELAANDQVVPKSSHDETHKRTCIERGPEGLHFLQYDFAVAAPISQASVFWFESTDWRRETAPESWKLLYLDGNQWHECANCTPYETALHGFNTVHFAPVTTNAVRLVCTPAPGYSVGLLELHVC